MRLPVLFPPIPTDDGRLLMDGGVLDNLPVDILLERDEGPVVAVNISMGGGGGGRPARTGRPRVPALGETLLRTMTIGAGGAVDRRPHQGAAVLTPATMGVGLLEFHQIDRMVQSGREAGRALLAEGSLDLGAKLEPEPRRSRTPSRTGECRVRPERPLPLRSSRASASEPVSRARAASPGLDTLGRGRPHGSTSERMGCR